MKLSNHFGHWVAGLSLMGLFGFSLFAGENVPVVTQQQLAKEFVSPPASARPWVLYFFNNGNLTKKGITADFEAMARVGIGGVVCMEIAHVTPKGPVEFASPQWMDIFTHACKEAQRLGIQINMNNDAGWTGSGGPWITPELSMQTVVWSETTVEGGKAFDGALAKPRAVKDYYQDIAVLAFPTLSEHHRIDNIRGKALFEAMLIPTARAEWPTLPAGSVIARESLVDLTDKMDSAGKLAYDFPAGTWTVLRIGHTTTGQMNAPSPAAGLGLECDKFSKEAAKVMFDGLMGRLVAENKALTGRDKTLVSTHIDSWEVGSQNWTPRMREEFKKRRGYELLSFLPAFTGRVVQSLEVTERFLWDLRQTASELILENYAGEFRRLANRQGLGLTIEAYDGRPVPVGELDYGGQADVPMGEFWSWPKFHKSWSCTEMAFSAHTYGKKIVGAEAFTALETEKWQGHPANLKDLGDWAFTEGINRFVIHRYAAQPWDDRVPGMAMGPWGLHYERTQTWWEQSKPWHDYLARCQYLLQQGLFVADVAYLQPEGSPRRYTPPADGALVPREISWSLLGVPVGDFGPRIRSGYNFDCCTPDVVMERMSVNQGRIVLPDGMSYAVLVLPEVETMTPKLLRKISELADQGATIIASTKPPQKSPSLADLNQGDAEVKKLTDALWSSGKIITGKTAAQVLGARGVKPDFSATPALRYIHRTLDEAEVYFVANPDPHEVIATAAFRVTGRQPEFWWPDTGRIEPVNDYEIKDGTTRIPLRLDPNGSVFVIFREATQDSKVTGKNWVDTIPVQEIAGPWEIAFDPKWGGPAKVTFDKLDDWSKRTEDGIKYYSGAAVYRTSFSLKSEVYGLKSVVLDLGKVAVMAEVRLNGKDLGILWKPPYRVDVTEAIRPGENRLEINVVNLLINRQIGDEQLPEDSERSNKEEGAILSWPQWLQDGKPSPTGRFTFSTWRLWKKSDPLVESGLLGPVTIQALIK